MFLSLVFVLAAGVCAFVMGYALNQGTTCAVTAARQVIDERQTRMLVGFGVAVAAAGLVWLPLAWFGGGRVHLAEVRPIGWGLVAGAALLGVGAVLNRACLLGSISRIGDGKVRFLGLPIGLALGFALADRILPTMVGVAANPLDRPSGIGVAAVVLFTIVLVGGWAWMRRAGDSGDAERWPWRMSMVVLGVSGALLFAIAPGWTVADAVRRGVFAFSQGGPMSMAGMSKAMAVGALGLLMFSLLCVGAIAAGLRRRTFRFRRPGVLGISRSIAGGAVMAFGAALVPGGNDTLLLADLPGLTLSGFVAYVVMSGAVFALLIARKAMPTQPR